MLWICYIRLLRTGKFDILYIWLAYIDVSASPGHKRMSGSNMSPLLTSSTQPDVRQLPQPSPVSHATQRDGTRSTEARRHTAIDPSLAPHVTVSVGEVQDQGYKNALRAWSRFRFVRAGWFTPAEAIDYVH
jgi:hypothetical protein